MTTDISGAERPLEIYALYDHPSDFPHSYILRRYLVTKDGLKLDERFLMHSPNVEILRDYMISAMGLVKLERDPSDDAWLTYLRILETYI